MQHQRCQSRLGPTISYRCCWLEGRRVLEVSVTTHLAVLCADYLLHAATPGRTLLALSWFTWPAVAALAHLLTLRLSTGYVTSTYSFSSQQFTNTPLVVQDRRSGPYLWRPPNGNMGHGRACERQ